MSDKLTGLIVRELEDRGWSQRELSRRADISVSTISDVLSQKAKPGFQFCASIAKALNLPAENVLRLAGLLPPQPEQTATVNEFVYLLNQLPTEEQKELLLVAKAWVEGRERQRSTKAR